MIILKNGNFLELICSFSRANRRFRVIDYPFLNQIKAKLQVNKNNSTQFGLNILGIIMWLAHFLRSNWFFLFFFILSRFCYLIFCKTHLNNPIWVLGKMIGIAIISLPSIKIRRVLAVSIVCCHFRQQMAIVIIWNEHHNRLLPENKSWICLLEVEIVIDRERNWEKGKKWFIERKREKSFSVIVIACV